MQSVNKKKFEDAMQNEYYQKILMKACNSNLKNICTRDEIKSVMMSTLWSCIEKFNNQKNVKFSTYLYRSIHNNARRIYKKKAREFNNTSLIENFHSILTVSEKDRTEARDILDSVKDLNSELHNILIQKYYYGMTNKEIGQSNGYGKEAARKKLKKALELCREIVYDNVGKGTK
jgi:RNA polymerase sigma factor (sigma-70 family)